MDLADSTVENSFASLGLIRTLNYDLIAPTDPRGQYLRSGWGGSAIWSWVEGLTKLTVRLAFLILELFGLETVISLRLWTCISEIYAVIGVDLWFAPLSVDLHCLAEISRIFLCLLFIFHALVPCLRIFFCVYSSQENPQSMDFVDPSINDFHTFVKFAVIYDWKQSSKRDQGHIWFQLRNLQHALRKKMSNFVGKGCISLLDFVLLNKSLLVGIPWIIGGCLISRNP